ncbi:uncharacterized protein [Salminus brasiliensis]|uniref:uncharacterized protein n=1 Tax=Salminus brasiliensis TaxID=930266 RepID=UPI003B831AC1
MDRLQPPRPLCVDSDNLSRSWKSWREEFMLYVDLTVDDDDEKTTVKLFSYLVCESGGQLLDTLMGEAAKETWTIRDIVASFDAHCNPSVNETGERYGSFSRNQGSSENIDCCVTELKLLVNTCNFGPLRDSLIRDRTVCGSNSNGMRDRLLREKNLALDTCVQLCRAAELSRENAKAISGPSVEEVHAVQRPVLHKQAVESVDCKFCGKLHEKSKQKCPAYGTFCFTTRWFYYQGFLC